MQPNPWIVELAVRHEQAKEQRVQKRMDRSGWIGLAAPATSVADLGQHARGRLLAALGMPLERLGRAVETRARLPTFFPPPRNGRMERSGNAPEPGLGNIG
jgi:hypothetical protein